MWELLNENKEWLFSGGGVVFLGWIGTRMFKKNKRENGEVRKQNIKAGDNSKNYQSGRDISITESRDTDER